ncbi:hypothetical protein KY342_01690 [Candidatus Woesearchaeota archaeon]|nr:hypothetical protein [Candidatus Woesearchaeota archaeon]
MNKKILTIGVLLIAVLLINGCAISDYLTGQSLEDQYSLLTEEDLEGLDEDELGELEVLDEEEVEESIEELDEEEIEEEEVIEEFQAPTEAITITVKENDYVSLTPNAVDPDEDSIQFTFTPPLDEDGTWDTDYGDAGEYFITVTASDGELETSRQVLLFIERVNMPPVIENIDDITVDEGSTLIVTPKVSDPNGDEFTVVISEPVGDDGVWEIGYQDHGQYSMTITAEDIDSLVTEQEIMITVNRKNMAPEIEPIDDIEIFEGESVLIEPFVSDLNGDEVTVTISEPVGDEGLWETAFTDHGEYEITIAASDGELETIELISLIVKDINKAPIILDIVQEGQEFAVEETEEETEEEQ